MRLLVAFAVIYFISISPVCAENTASTINIPTPAIESPLASKSLLLDISLIGQEKLVTVGQHGHILLSNDGKKWQQANVPVQVTLTNVFFLNEQLGWAVGHDATILHSQDGGLNWQVQQYLPLLEKPLFDIYFKNPQQGIAVGAYGQVFRTNDGGSTWQNEFHQEILLADDVEYLNELKAEDEAAYLDEITFILPHFNRLVQDGGSLFLLGETGLLAKSDDFGLTWQQFDNFYQGSFFSLARTKTGNVLVAGLRGHVFRSLNHGSQWDEVPTNTTALLNDIVFANDERIFILGNNGMLLISTDDGESFSKIPQQDGKTLIAGVWFKGQLIAVSDVGIKVVDLSQE
ncbi:WD40/YVTN/BNR-like repeat-containing protein [Colwellia psychrerythraea]|uniref:BNR repeat protein n=1 Tax=Colwellia psychrerythraea (strain 34H / ATCC BAA-681) TaxID=167879 RepID=Q480K3_COLP3|nr:YCF48-related protein [Colwellia psychrerythraea]AAZ24840.1 BNR repeat protein [Colwellia psychrerythraea 34H]